MRVIENAAYYPRTRECLSDTAYNHLLAGRHHILALAYWQRLKTYPAPDYRPVHNRANGWGFDAEQQRKATYTGMGFDINIHDQFACESPGRIADRTREHLGTSDKGIVLYRRLLVDAIEKAQKGEKTMMMLDAPAASALTGPPAVDGIGPTGKWEEYYREADAARRRNAPWGAKTA